MTSRSDRGPDLLIPSGSRKLDTGQSRTVQHERRGLQTLAASICSQPARSCRLRRGGRCGHSGSLWPRTATVISGVNLAVLVEAATCTDALDAGTVERLVALGRSALTDASSLAASRSP